MNSEPAPIFDPQLGTDATGMTVNYFHRASKLDPPSLILRPAFQRNLVWNQTQQSFLIDSILRGLPVPELYLQVTTSADGDERITVVDGQQRISTCIAFIDGSLTLDESDDLDPAWKGKTFEQLDGTLKARFRGFKFIVRNLPPTANDQILREIFRRLNRTVEALEPQELRHAAYTGPFIQLVERASAAAALNELGVFSPKDYQRRRNDEFVAEVFFAIDAEAFPNKKEGLDELFLTYERRGLPAAKADNLARRFSRALTLIEAGLPALRRTRFKNKSDCYTLLVLLARRAEKLTTDQAQADEIVARLTEFSALVNDIKREESQGRSVDDLVSSPMGANALSYLRAVERAASDRLSRVRRHESLDAVLGQIIERHSRAPLTEADEAWPLAGEDLEEPATDRTEEAEDLRAVQDTLLAVPPTAS